ncbi:1,2-phenylacetyl-CoA epoxidase subunit PaaC [Pelagibius sp. Alg239-R121]|uniref:1,2-phenylacetyl-CoA epoxidase subunit PaaC n=1 Tax=Pelagibius sp. Alg239-R121 TaxID=2993448 RepID=UPI0024A703C0|nr:1,2-phenylacetyl-CoA epoxidase subunit PaaC [Pelagibius sp. Alg239-R121]
MPDMIAGAKFKYVLRLADDQLILGQRLGEWCGHAPTLEEDLALANIGLDLLGQARSLFTYAGEVEGEGRSEDDLAFLRQERDYFNALLMEQPNGDFAVTIVRQLFHAAFMVPFWSAMTGSSDKTLAAVAAKSLKEVEYHLRHCSEWIIRLGDGTEESHVRTQAALDELWGYASELFEMDEVADEMLVTGVGVDAAALKDDWDATVDAVLARATLNRPEDSWSQTGGRSGQHSEHMGHILSDLQYMQRTYPGLSW